MHKFTTIAYQYAKAAFNFSILHKSVDHWQNMLAFASEVTKNKQISSLIACSSLSSTKLADLFIKICGNQLDRNGKNLVQIMAENHRLKIMPIVLRQFMILRYINESITIVEVISAKRLTEHQLLKINSILEIYFSRKIKINSTIDATIMAGMIIKLGDIVIDCSVKGRLERFASFLQS